MGLQDIQEGRRGHGDQPSPVSRLVTSKVTSQRFSLLPATAHGHVPEMCPGLARSGTGAAQMQASSGLIPAHGSGAVGHQNASLCLARRKTVLGPGRSAHNLQKFSITSPPVLVRLLGGMGRGSMSFCDRPVREWGTSVCHLVGAPRPWT